MSSVTYIPPVESRITFETGRNAEYRLLDLQGISSVPLSTFTAKGPRQPGDTLADVIVASRVVEVTGLIQGQDIADYWNLRALAIRAFSMQPARLLGSLSAGVLQVELTDGPIREIDAIPQSAEVIRSRGSIGVSPIDVEFYCPTPYWRTTADMTQTFAVDDTVNVNNPGDVDAAVAVVITGTTFTQFKFRNLTTGEDIIVDYASGSEDTIQVRTGYADKVIEATASGVVTSEMGSLDADDSIMWQLRPGINQLKFEVTGDGAATADLTFRPLYSGI